MKPSIIRGLLLVTALLVSAEPGRALVTAWTNASGGDWQTGSNWSQGVPGPVDTADIVLNGTYTVTVNTPASARTLRLGGATGSQTVLIDGTGSLTCTTGSLGVPVQIEALGTIDVVANSLTGGSAGSTAITNSGQLFIRAGATVETATENIVNETGGMLTLDGGSVVADTLQNHGVISSTSGSLSDVFGFTRNHVDGTISIAGYVQTYSVTSNGLVDLLNGGELNLGTNNDFTNNASGLLRFAGGTVLGYMDGTCHLLNGGELRMQADTSQIDDDADITVRYIGGLTSSLVRVLAGTLQCFDSATFAGDSVFVAAACSLRVIGITLMSGPGTRMSGGGRVHFADGATATVTSTWQRTLGIYCSNQYFYPTQINFDPAGGPPDTVASVHVVGGDVTFTVPPTSVLAVDTLRQEGGTIVGELILIAVYDWAQGTLTTNATPTVTIPPEAALNVYSGQDKTLASLELIVEGAAVFTGPGTLLLSDTARVNIRPIATLDVGPGFRMAGLGDLYNSGAATFDPLLDTIRIDVFIWNSPTSRTPGTIDVLSSPVVYSGGGSNEGTVRIQDGGGLYLTEEFKNEGGTIEVLSGGKLEVIDTLVNNANGNVELSGGSEISGDGEVTNGGSLTMSGGALLTATNVPIQPRVVVLADSGFVNVLTDTLTLLGGGENHGVITIAAGAVLKVLGTFTNEATGLITGQGTLDVSGATFVNNGTINAGSSPGRLFIAGDVTLGPLSVLNMEMAGTQVGTEYDQIAVNGTINFGGTLNLIRQNGYYPSANDTLVPFTYLTFSGEFATVNGLELTGEFLELNFGPFGCQNYVCDGVSEIDVGPATITDTIQQTVALLDTLRIPICNVGWCPLTFGATLQNMTPPSPIWAAIPAPDTSGLVLRTRCDTLRVMLNATGLAAGTYTVELAIASNDPVAAVVAVAITLVVEHGPDIWEIGGPSPDFATFGAAAAYLNTTTIAYPQIFNVHPGTYGESITLNANPGSSATNTILFRPVDSLSPPVLQSSAAFILRLLGADYVTIDGLHIRRTATGAGVAILDTADADNNTFRNLTVSGADSGSSANYGILVSNPASGAATNDSNRVEASYVHGFVNGIALGRTSAVVNNSATRNELTGSVIENCVTCVYLRRQTQLRVHELTIRPGYANAAVSAIIGIDVNRLSLNDTVKIYDNNLLRFGAQGSGFGIITRTNEPNSYTQIFNNMVSDFGGVLGNSTGIAINEQTRAGVFFNTVRMSENAAPGLVTISALSLDGATTNASVFNNILASEATLDSSSSIARLGASFTSDRNCLWGAGTRYRTGRSGTTNYVTLSQWQSAMSQDANSRQDVPGFESTASLHIDGYWTTCEAGATPVAGIATDIDGQPRNALTPDIGADEFTGLTDKVDSLVVRRVSGTNNVRLNWEATAGAVSYLVYAATSYNTLAMTPANYLGAAATNTYTHLGAAALPATQYWYLVRPSTLP